MKKKVEIESVVDYKFRFYNREYTLLAKVLSKYPIDEEVKDSIGQNDEQEKANQVKKNFMKRDKYSSMDLNENDSN